MNWAEIQDVLNYGIEIGGTEVTLGHALLALVLVIVTIWLSRVLERTVERALGLARVTDVRTIAVAGTITQYTVLAVGFVVALGFVGIDLTGLFAAGAVMAVAIGFAAQNVLQNFFSGIILLSEGAIKPGDVLEVEGEVVRVTRMGIRSTVARTRDEEEVILPNTLLAQSSVKNYTLQDSLYRLRTRVGVTYGSDMKRVRESLEKAAAELPEGHGNREPVILMWEFADSAVVFDVSVWVDDPWPVMQTRSKLNELIWWALKDAGITIAFPQMDVHFDKPVEEALERLPRAS
jgi:small-conductance mechanosensitive channel